MDFVVFFKANVFVTDSIQDTSLLQNIYYKICPFVVHYGSAVFYSMRSWL